MKNTGCIISLLSMSAILMCSCGNTNSPENPVCEHLYSHVDAKAPSFYEDGNIEYFVCDKCSKLFDKNKKEIEQSATKVRLELFNSLDRTDPVTAFGKELNFTYKESEITDIINRSNALISKINSGSYYDAISTNNLINEILAKLDFVKKQYDIAYVIAEASAKAEDYTTKSNVYNAYYKLQDEYYGIYVAIAKDGRYNDKFFKNKTQEEINDFIKKHEGSGGGSPKETTERKIENLLNKYKAGQIERYTALHDYVELAKQLATEKSYSSYLDYSYKNYGREYTVLDAAAFSNKVLNYIKPLAQSIREKLANAKKNEDVSRGITALDKNFFGKNIDLLREYAVNLGGNYKEHFQTFFEDGNYFFSDIANPNATAYTANSLTLGRYIFASKNYQDLMNFTHEFGHYNAGENFGDVTSLDLSETQSQGNEMMLVSFMKNKSSYDPQIALGFNYSQISSMTNLILLGCSINEFEQFIYNNEFNEATIESKWTEILNKYGASLTRNKLDYLYQVVLNYRGYYISYAVSGVAALELYAKSFNNFDDAAASYLSIANKDSDNEKFKKSLENAGLFDVFSNDSFALIKTIGDI